MDQSHKFQSHYQWSGFETANSLEALKTHGGHKNALLAKQAGTQGENPHAMLRSLKNEILKARHAKFQNKTNSFVPEQTDALSPMIFGLTEIDMALPNGGLPPVGLHEIKPAAHKDQLAALYLTFGLLKRRVSNQENQKIIISVTDQILKDFHDFYTNGITDFDFGSNQIIIVTSLNTADAVQVMENALKNKAIACVFGHIPLLQENHANQLHHLAIAQQLACFILSNHQEAIDSPSISQWRVEATQQNNIHNGMTAKNNQPNVHFAHKRVSWQLQLNRLKGGLCGGHWNICWCPITQSFLRAA